jgi:hypothetical protein
MSEANNSGNPEKPDKAKEKGVTRSMPMAQLKDFDDWVRQQKKPEPGDHGQAPPEAPQDLKEPRVQGSEREESGGNQS